MPYHIQRTIELLDTDTVPVKKYIGRSGRGRGAADDFMTNGRGPVAGQTRRIDGPDPDYVDFAFRDALDGNEIFPSLAESIHALVGGLRCGLNLEGQPGYTRA